MTEIRYTISNRHFHLNLRVGFITTEFQIIHCEVSNIRDFLPFDSESWERTRFTGHLFLQSLYVILVNVCITQSVYKISWLQQKP